MNRERLTLFGAAVVMSVGVWAQALAGAPRSATILQLVGVAAALGLVWIAPRAVPRTPGLIARWAVVVGGVLLLALPLFQPGIEGAHRWLWLGPVAIQPLPLVLPLLVWLAARDDPGDPRWSAPGPIGLILAAAVLAGQPDQQGAAALAATSAAMLLSWDRPPGVNIGRRVVVALAALAGLTVAMNRDRMIEPVAYVEGVIPAAWAAAPAVGVLAGLALAAVVILIGAVAWVPAGVSDRRRAGLERVGWLLAVLWAGFSLGTLSGDYLVPVIGYGVSWVVGWGLTLGLALAERRRLPN